MLGRTYHITAPQSVSTGSHVHCLIGSLDEAYRRVNIMTTYHGGRAADSPWAVSTDPFGHGPIVDFDLLFDWIDAVLAARLPPAQGEPLRGITVTEGWIGELSHGAITP